MDEWHTRCAGMFARASAPTARRLVPGRLLAWPCCRESRAGAFNVEAEPRLRPVAEPYGAESVRARVDPITVDAEDSGELGRVDERLGRARRCPQELGHAPRDSFDVIRVERHRRSGAAAASALRDGGRFTRPHAHHCETSSSRLLRRGRAPTRSPVLLDSEGPFK